MKNITSGILTFVFLGLNAYAADFAVDPAHTNVQFTVRHMFSKVNGSFKKFEGHFNFDAAKPEKSKVKFAIDTASINTENEKRDAHLKSPDFFDTAKYPQISFESKKLTVMGEKKYKLDGKLTMHGKTKEVAFDVEFLGMDKDPWGGTKAGFTATAVVNRKDFDITWNKKLDSGGLLVGEEVTLQLNVEADQKK
jgi:polyisoprenoid-binding protein YceI